METYGSGWHAFSNIFWDFARLTNKANYSKYITLHSHILFFTVEPGQLLLVHHISQKLHYYWSWPSALKSQHQTCYTNTQAINTIFLSFSSLWIFIISLALCLYQWVSYLSLLINLLCLNETYFYVTIYFTICWIHTSIYIILLFFLLLAHVHNEKWQKCPLLRHLIYLFAHLSTRNKWKHLDRFSWH
jgi:hypothetical protein